MSAENVNNNGINALGAQAAYNLANVTKTRPQFGSLTPKWLTRFLEFKGLETGIFRVNRLKEGRWGRRRKSLMEREAQKARPMAHLLTETAVPEVREVREEHPAAAVQILIMPEQPRSLPMIRRMGSLTPVILLMKMPF